MFYTMDRFAWKKIDLLFIDWLIYLFFRTMFIMFVVLADWQSHCESSSDECELQYQAATNPQTKQTDFGDLGFVSL